MTLREQQSLFMKLLPRLIDKAYELGYELTGGELLRDPRIAALNAANGIGIASSLHIDSLALDLRLFKDGQYLSESSDHLPLGEFWKTLHADCRWGGDFTTRPDGNHYSLTWEGRA